MQPRKTKDKAEEGTMITLTKLNGEKFVLNCELIETIEQTPDTIITTIHGKKFVVKESIEHIVETVLKYKGKVAFLCRTQDLQ